MPNYRNRGKFSLPVSVFLGVAIVLLFLPLSNAQTLLSASLSSASLKPSSTEVGVTPIPLLQQTFPLENPLLAKRPDLARLIVVRAFLRGAIHYAEGTYPNALGVSPYLIILGEETFEGFEDHPRRLVTLNWGTPYEVTSDAAGACQFTSEIWDQLHQHYPKAWDKALPAFHPKNQDIGCALLWTEAGGYKELMAGTSIDAQGKIAVDVERFTTAVHTSCGIWSSFPCANGVGAYDHAAMGHQRAKPIEEIWRNFRVALADQQTLVDFMFSAMGDARSR